MYCSFFILSTICKYGFTPFPKPLLQQLKTTWQVVSSIGMAITLNPKHVEFLPLMNKATIKCCLKIFFWWHTTYNLFLMLSVRVRFRVYVSDSSISSSLILCKSSYLLFSNDDNMIEHISWFTNHSLHTNLYTHLKNVNIFATKTLPPKVTKSFTLTPYQAFPLYTNDVSNHMLYLPTSFRSTTTVAQSSSLWCKPHFCTNLRLKHTSKPKASVFSVVWP